MNIFFPIFILTIFFFSLRIIDRARHRRLSDTISKREKELLDELGFFKNDKL